MPFDTTPGSRAAAGFTLLQTLIAVAAVSVIGGLLLGRLAVSRQSPCAGNMRRLALAQYEQDNDQSFPPKFYEGPQGWAGRVYPYVKSAAPFKCPEDATAARGAAVPVSYGMNANLAGRLPRLMSPARTVLLFEASGAQVEVDKADEGSQNWKRAPASRMLSPCGRGLPAEKNGYPAGWWGRGTQVAYATGDMDGRDRLDHGAGSVPRHGGGSNFLGADGHVAYLLPGQVSSGADGTPGSPQDRARAGQAAATDSLFLPDGSTPVQITFSAQ